MNCDITLLNLYVPVIEIKRAFELVWKVEECEVCKSKSALVGYVVNAKSNLVKSISKKSSLLSFLQVGYTFVRRMTGHLTLALVYIPFDLYIDFR